MSKINIQGFSISLTIVLINQNCTFNQVTILPYYFQNNLAVNHIFLNLFKFPNLIRE
jgi:hypothetical protein